MFFEEKKYIIEKGRRIFIDICESGCGNGCLYCYAPYHNEPQKLLKKKQIDAICRYVRDNYCFDNKIISLCPNTEPLKSKKSIELIIYIIKFFSHENCYIQISTKELIPEYFLENIEKDSKSRIYINISVPTIKNSNLIEPNAALAEQRINNFLHKKIYDNINFCLYIKPFILQEQEQELYVDYINRYDIDTVCVGPTFNIDSEIPCISLYDQYKAQKMYSIQISSIDTFISLLRKKTKARVFSSSVCCIYSDYYNECVLKLFDYGEQLCRDCSLKRSLVLNEKDA